MMALKKLNLDQLRTYAISRSLFKPTTLRKAIEKLGFVQADPIRAPARAQDLTLRHRVKLYRAGDLEASFEKLPIEEDFFVNYGFVPRAVQQLMHPRAARKQWPQARLNQAQRVLEFVRSKGVVHPAEVDAHFKHGSSRSGFGGNSRVSTQLLDGMHYRGWLRVAGRSKGIRTYATSQGFQSPGEPSDMMDQLVNLIVAKYAPLPKAALSQLVMMLQHAAPQWRDLRRAALNRALQRLPSAELAGTTWFWPEGENPSSRRYELDDELRLLAPFDPVVWDRRRFELFWNWAYRFEAYTPASKRQFGYYALPMLWRGQVLGWANAQVNMLQGNKHLTLDCGYVLGKAPRDPVFKLALETEKARFAAFLGLRNFI